MALTPYSIVLLLSAGLLVGLSIYALRNLKPPIARLFSLWILLGALWDVMYALELSTLDLPGRIFWLQFRIIPLAWIPIILLTLSLEYRGQRAWLTRPRLALLMIIPLATTILSLTSRYHHLFRYNFRLDTRGPVSVLLADRGPAFGLHMAYSYAVIFVALALLILAFRAQSYYLRDILVLTIGACIPFFMDLLFQLGITPIPGLNLAPASVIFTSLFFVWALLRFNLLKVIPVARNAVLESIRDLAVVLDLQGMIVDFNRAAGIELNLTPHLLGKPLSALPEEWAEALKNYPANLDSCEEISLLAHGNTRIFELTVSSVQDQRQHPLGWLILLHEITIRKQTEQALQQRNRDLADLNRIVGSITSSLSLNQTLKHILDATPHFFPGVYSAAVQLVDEDAGWLSTRTASKNVSLAAQQMTFQPGEGIAGLVFQEHQPIYVPDVTQEPRYTLPPVPPVYRSLLAVPLLYLDQALGALCITALQPHAFTEEDQVRLEILAGYAAIAVQNAHLYEQTLKDAETKSELLREVNHRIRNNLVSILSLLKIEQTQLEPKPARQVLNDLEERVRGILVVHDLLSTTHWQPMPVEQFVREIVQSAISSSPISRKIHLVIACPTTGESSSEGEPGHGLMLAPHQATHVALALNELATNSVKHAFAGRSSGVIQIELAPLPGTPDLRLRYQDDGPGWPEEVLAGQRENVGLGLIRSAARDRISLSNASGAVAELVFGYALIDPAPPGVGDKSDP
jgi:PAS domain S-box-containing protein